MVTTTFYRPVFYTNTTNAIKIKQNTHRKSITYKLTVSVAILVMINLLIIGVKQLEHNNDFMNTLTLATTVKPETFTELYFADNANLPSVLAKKQRISFTFITHNLELKTTTYPYEVYVDENGKKITIDKGQFTLNQDSYKKIAESYIPIQSIKEAKIVVNLINTDQQIYFYMKGTDAKTR